MNSNISDYYLIDAAPDMLEVLKALVKSDYCLVTGRGFDMAILSRAIAAIDKAEGRSSQTQIGTNINRTKVNE